MSAARGWWTLRYFGHRAVRVLDGGYRAWTGAGLAVTTAEPAPAPGDFIAEPGQMPVLDAAGAQAAARTGLLLDARAGERYRGETEPVDPVAGHIPGAVSAPTAGNVNPDGTFKDPAELAARFATLCFPGGTIPPRPPLLLGGPIPPTPLGRGYPPPVPPGPRTAVPASPRPTRSSPSRWPGSPPRSTSVPGPTGSPTPPARWRPAPAIRLSHPGPVSSGPVSRGPAGGGATATPQRDDDPHHPGVGVTEKTGIDTPKPMIKLKDCRATRHHRGVTAVAPDAAASPKG